MFFYQSPGDHLSGCGCPRCAQVISNKELEWLSSLNVNNITKQHKIKVGDRRFRVDGYDSKTNTIYEFFGSYWHGNPSKYDENDINATNKKSFGQLFDETFERIIRFKQNGYNVIWKWED